MTTDDKPKFTPGPWEVRDKTYGEHRLISVVSDSPMVIIADMPKRYDKLGDEWEKAFNIDEVAANAALIAQAPEMYARLEQVAEDFEALGMLCNRDKVLELLAKARGEGK